MDLIPFVLLGLVSGFFAGLLGLGGGIITVPVLVLFALPYLNFPPNEVMHIAVASSMAAIIPTSLVSIYAHAKQQGIIWPIAFALTPGLFIGGILGAFSASEIARQSLQYTFALFLVFVAIYMFLPAKLFKPSGEKVRVQSFASLPIASISAALGVGGGTMTVPYLIWRGIDLRKAIGISAYCGLPIAVASSLAYYIIQNTGSLGQFIYFPAVFGIALGSLISAPLGAICTHKWPVLLIKRLFSMILLVVALKFIVP